MGMPALQWVLLPSPMLTGPCGKADHPSVGATDPSGFVHETSIHVPACARPAPTARTISAASASPIMPPRPIAILLKVIQYRLGRLLGNWSLPYTDGAVIKRSVIGQGFVGNVGDQDSVMTNAEA